MTVKITKPIDGGVVGAIASKSAAHRLLICAALADRETFITCHQRSEDIDATARCLQALGADIRYEESGFWVTPIEGRRGQRPLQCAAVDAAYGVQGLDCGESGSTLRFMLPICGALGVDAAFHMGGRLPTRPLTGLYEEMVAHGCSLSPHGTSPLVCEGQLISGEYTLPGNISSQFVSGLLFALPLLGGDSQICVTNGLESRPYVDMTLDALAQFGIKISEEIISENELIFHVKGGQIYRSPREISTEGDWSNAAFWLSAGAIGTSSITMTGLDMNSRQGDKAIVEFLARFGAKVSTENDAVMVSPKELHGIDINAADTPDLVPILAAVASVAEGTTVICNAERLRIKESDRLKTVAETLTQLGADVTETDDGLVINGKPRLRGGEVQSHGDHRIAMMVAVLSIACDGAVTINGAEAVRKSYPAFFEDFVMLGGICEND